MKLAKSIALINAYLTSPQIKLVTQNIESYVSSTWISML